MISGIEIFISISVGVLSGVPYFLYDRLRKTEKRTSALEETFRLLALKSQDEAKLTTLIYGFPDYSLHVEDEEKTPQFPLEVIIRDSQTGDVLSRRHPQHPDVIAAINDQNKSVE